MATPLRVGLVGAGPWASAVHAPGLAAHETVALAGVFARREAAARELTAAHGGSPCTSLTELLERCDAVAFAVPPAVQADLAVRAAEAGKHLILEKPIAADLAAAQRLRDAVDAAGVASIMMLILRYAEPTASWLAAATAGGWAGGDLRWLSGALLGETASRSPWRAAGGALDDIGPHALDLLDATLGEISDVLAAHRAPGDLWRLLFRHEGGATSTAALSLGLPMRPTVLECAIYGEGGYHTISGKPASPADAYAAVLDEFAELVATGATQHPCDVRRGLHLQRILARARERALR
ncbi:Gfo/Idh/MocA family oxidoreductase [Haloechinothrix sp. LS1_15]|uniref:Gfo/Idh/MocA family protein n=1 Tax=Haloechinothrix sp. LS1_15 TaxID=2652248 RepID=UPI00294611AD|nr:Gfo/Idh/MocA family oxidoreductase [Haloechinothrix sp. LS1_15]MDV6012452.1 Gfo/Idh/MocA family oxidoreductase [Haloechinothrix sp. LS1_15]